MTCTNGNCKREAQEGYRRCESCRRNTTRATRRWQIGHPEKHRANASKYAARHRAKLRAAVLDHYGRACACCGTEVDAFLTIDHIEGGGSAHRRQVGNIYQWLVRKEFPAGFRTLCMNCQVGTYRLGVCPCGGPRR